MVAIYPQQNYIVDIRQKSFKCTPKGIINYIEIRYAYKQMNHEPPKMLADTTLIVKHLNFLHDLKLKNFTSYFYAFYITKFYVELIDLVIFPQRMQFIIPSSYEKLGSARNIFFISLHMGGHF